MEEHPSYPDPPLYPEVVRNPRRLQPGEERVSVLSSDRPDQDVPEDDFVHIAEYLQIILRHKLAILAIALIGIVAAGLYSLLVAPMYRAETTLETQGIHELFTPTGFVNTEDKSLQTQVQILKSQTLLVRVAIKLSTQKRPPLSRGTDRLESWRRALHLPNAGRSITLEGAIKTAMEKTEVSPLKQSNVLQIQCVSTDPQVAAAFANTLAEEYIQQNHEERWKAYQNTGEWLAGAQQELKQKLEKSEQELLTFAQASGLQFTGENDNVAEDKLRQLQLELSKAQADRITKQTAYEASLSSKPEALPEVLRQNQIAQYERQLADLRRQLAEAITTLTPAHYKVKRLESQIAELESLRARERDNIVRSIQIEYESALNRERKLAADYQIQSSIIADQAAKLIHYNILKRQVGINRQLYELTLQKGKEASIASAMRASNARVIDAAQVPLKPYRPNELLNIIIGLVGGIFAGSGLAILRERLDSRVRMPGMLPAELGLRELGVIPSASADPELRAARRFWFLPAAGRDIRRRRAVQGNILFDDRSAGHHRDGAPDGIELVTWRRSPSLMAESFRSTIASILSVQKTDRPSRVILVTSPSPKEGKSTVLSNLGIALAEMSPDVLLIDCDMRLPRLHRIFDLPNTWGLSDLLSEQSPIEGYPDESLARKTEIPGLYVLPSGPARVGISRLLYSNRFDQLLAGMRSRYEAVLIDTAPMLTIADARILSRLVDGVILVLRAGHTARDDARTAARYFEDDGTPVLGTILNDWNPRSMGSSYYATYYSDYYRKAGL